MTDNDFIELLESVRNDVIAYNDNDVFTVGDILGLINRLQARVKKCEKVEHFADKTIEAVKKENEKQKAEIEHQQFKIYNLEQANKELAIQLESMRISANSYKYLYEKMQKENQNEIM